MTSSSEPRPVAAGIAPGYVRVDATQVRSMDGDYAWALLIHDVVVEVIVRDGRTTHYSVSVEDFFETEGPTMRTIIRVPELVERMGIRMGDVSTFSVSFSVPRAIYDRIAKVDSQVDHSGTNDLLLHLGKYVTSYVL